MFERFNVLDRYNKENEEQLLLKKLPVPSIQGIFAVQAANLEEKTISDIICNLSETLDIIPGDLDTVFMQRESASGDQRLYNFIDEHEIKEKYDYIFIDCPPTYSFYTVAALLTSDYYFVPVVPDIYSILGINLLENVVLEVKKANRFYFKNRTLKNLGIVFTKVTEKPKVRKLMDALKEHEDFKDKINFFGNEFPNMDKISTCEISNFIIDRKDEKLTESLASICYEFLDRIGS